MTLSAPLFLALRYLRPKRSFVSVITLISVLGVMLGVGVLVVVMSVFKGWQVDFKKRLIGFEPHLLLTQGPGPSGPVDPDAPPMARTNWRDLLPVLRQMPGVTSAQPISRGVIVAEREKKAEGIEVLGLRAEEDNALIKKLAKHLKSGGFVLPGGNIILPGEMARRLGARPGGTIFVNAAESLNKLVREVRANDGEPDPDKRAAALDGVIPTGSELKLAGILRSDTAGLRGYVPMNIGQELFLLDDGVSGIEVELADPDRAGRAAGGQVGDRRTPRPDWSVGRARHGRNAADPTGGRDCGGCRARPFSG